MSGRALDENHASRKNLLSRISLSMVIGGIALVALGAMGFAGSILIDSIRWSAFVAMGGMFLVTAGGVLLFFGAPLALFAHLGNVVRYQAEEIVPVGEDITRRGVDFAEEIAPRVARLEREIAPDIAAAREEVVHGVVRGARKGWNEGEP